MAGVSVWDIVGHGHETKLPENPAKSAWDSAAAGQFSCYHFLPLSVLPQVPCYAARASPIQYNSEYPKYVFMV